MSDNITILVSTISGRLSGVLRLIKNISSPLPNIIIVVQEVIALSEEDNNIIRQLNSIDKVNLIISKTTGVTTSRNIAISYLKTDYAIFADDDIVYCDNFIDTIISSFERHPDAAFLTFNIIDEKNTPLKNYPLGTVKHNKLSILKVGTIEIAINRKKTTGVFFPEDMGAGKYLFCCDEPVYLGNLMKKKLNGYHIPYSICKHPRLSSGKKLKSKSAILSRYICFRRIFGNFIGSLLFVIFLLKNIKKIF